MDVGFEGRELAVEVGGVLAGQDGIAGKESVFEGVLRDAGFTFLGAGPVDFLALLRLALICAFVVIILLFLSWEQGLRFQSTLGWRG